MRVLGVDLPETVPGATDEWYAYCWPLFSRNALESWLYGWLDWPQDVDRTVRWLVVRRLATRVLRHGAKAGSWKWDPTTRTWERL